MLLYSPMERPRRSLIPCVSMAALAAVQHLQTTGFGFVFDDDFLVVQNQFLREAWSPLRAFAQPFWYGTPFSGGYYRPLVAASLALNGRFLGWGPASFHLVNVLLHALNAALLLLLLRRLTVPEWPAYFAALFFAVHPAAAWPVASVVARVDLLPALFLLLAWLAYSMGEGSSAPTAGDASPAEPTGPGIGPLASALLTGGFFLCALLSKESAIAFLVVPLLGLRVGSDCAAASDHTTGKARLPRTFAQHRRHALVASVAAILVSLALRFQAGMGPLLPRRLIDPLINPLPFLPFPGRLFAALSLSGRYLFYLILPIRFTDPGDYRPDAPMA